MSGSELRDLGMHLFSFAVVADTHLNENEYTSNSPFHCNRVANARTRYVVERLNQLRPELTIHLGDLVHPVPMLPTYALAAANFRQLTAALQGPLHLVPGNHDVGDKRVIWAPAWTVNDASLALWKQHFGEHYYSFDFRSLHFVVIDAQIINSGLSVEAEQRAWLERDLARHVDRRTFLCIHYPPYVSEPDERETYDNLGEPGRSWLLGLVEQFRPEAMFCGHVHNFWYNRYGETDCYILPSTAFVRHDYSELARVEPADERGRNDTAKLGFFVVKVYERGHVCHMERTYGATLDPGETMPPARERVADVHTWENRQAPLGLDLRHPWAEMVDLPPTGALDEFERKRARNDYPLLALWEMGIRKLRVPLQDLENPRTRERMRLLKRVGHEFTVYTLEVPDLRGRNVLVEHQDLVANWEVVCNWADVERTLAAVRELKDKAPIRTYLSKLWTKEDVTWDGSKYYHGINHGFAVREREDLERWLLTSDSRDSIDGFVFRVARDGSPWKEICGAVEFAGRLDTRVAVHIRMGSDNPAEEFTNDVANANRVAEALAVAMTRRVADRPALEVFLDTFADIDRGYFIRNGLVDRRWNPRLGGQVVRNLQGALNAFGEALGRGLLVEVASARICFLEDKTKLAALVLPEQKMRLDHLPTVHTGLTGSAGIGRCINLASGDVMPIAWERCNDGFVLPGGRACETPILITLGT